MSAGLHSPSPRFFLTFFNGKPSECQDSRQSTTGHASAGAPRIVAFPKMVTSNSPYASRRATISATGFDRAFLSMAATPTRMRGRAGPVWPSMRGS